MGMVFNRRNNLNTTTQVAVAAANTLTVENLFDNDPNTKWSTAGYSTNTSTLVTVSFTSSVVIDRVFLQNHNLKQFRIFYDGVTANTFTPAISETTNSATSNYYTFATITVSSISLQVDLATTADTEKEVGTFYVGQLMLSMERNPPANSYKPIIDRQQVIHRMPNGGVTQFVVANKFRTNLKWDFLTESFTSRLLNVYETATSFYFVPFGTSTSWDGKAYEVAWTNDFDFRHSDNNKDAGYGGSVVLEEIA